MDSGSAPSFILSASPAECKGDCGRGCGHGCGHGCGRRFIDDSFAPCQAAGRRYTGAVQHDRPARDRKYLRYATSEVERVSRRLHRVFDSLGALPYLGAEELSDFRYYEGLFDEALAGIDRKAREGRLRPLDLRGFPQDLRYPGYAARLGIFIGSFDPFQMTHMAMALRFLSSDAGEADALFVVPEGSFDPRKPAKTEYRFRHEVLRRQLAGVLDPFVVPLDIGSDADTIEIVRRLIALHAGASLRLTHVMGSDTLPVALRLLPEDLEAWGAAAERAHVALDFSIFVVKRERRDTTRALVEAARRLGVRIVVDHEVIGTPSSTDFRRERAITLVFPTEAILSRVELLFRYGMNRPWTSVPVPPEARADAPDAAGSGGTEESAGAPSSAPSVGGEKVLKASEAPSGGPSPLAPCGRPCGFCGSDCILRREGEGVKPGEPDYQI